jgi:hypothetical protein
MKHFSERNFALLLTSVYFRCLEKKSHHKSRQKETKRNQATQKVCWKVNNKRAEMNAT